MTFEIPTACEQSIVAFSHNNRYIVSGDRDGVVNIWDVKTRAMRRTFRDHVHPVSCCAFNFNDKIVASSSDHGEIILTEVSSGTASSPLLGISMDKINNIAYSHFTFPLLASADSSGSVTLWDTTSKKLLKTFADHNSSATCLTFSPLNDMLLASTGQTLIIFTNLRTWFGNVSTCRKILLTLNKKSKKSGLKWTNI